MAYPIHFPSLTEQSWVTNSKSIADILFSQFFLSDYSQTYVYYGKVASFAWVIEQSQSDDTKVRTLTKQVLLEYFGRYFTSVEVEVDLIDDPSDVSKQILKLWLSYTDSEGIPCSLGRTLSLMNGVSVGVIALNNDGTVPASKL